MIVCAIVIKFKTEYVLYFCLKFILIDIDNLSNFGTSADFNRA
jgi:hypothetical protein